MEGLRCTKGTESPENSKILLLGRLRRERELENAYQSAHYDTKAACEERRLVRAQLKVHDNRNNRNNTNDDSSDDLI